MVSPSVTTLESKLITTATEYQQNFYELCSDWNRYKKDEHGYLKDFIGYALFGSPKFIQEDAGKDVECKINSNDTNNGHFVYNDNEQKQITLIYEKIKEIGSGELVDDVILCGIIYNIIFNTKATHQTVKKKESELNVSGKSLVGESISEAQVFPVPIFKVKRQEKVKMKTLTKIYYVDVGGRTYDGFQDYLNHNTLPVCTMVLPKDGQYQIDPILCSKLKCAQEMGEDIVTKVWIEIIESPSSKLSAKLVTGGDIASTVITVASMGVGIAAMMTPVGAGVALASTIGAGVSGLWSVGRCAQQLADRGHHGESINVNDKEALGAWIGIAGGTLGLAASGGTVLLGRAVRTGATVGRAATMTYDAVLIGNLMINGIGVGFKSYDIFVNYIEGGTISAPDLFLLTTHIFFFCNSVVNIRLAQSFIETSQGQLLKDYEASLRSNRHRREFQRMMRNTRAASSNDVSCNEEIIRGINNISNRDDFFQAMVRNRKAFSSSGARASFSSNGRVMINSIMAIDPIEFANLPKDVRVDIVKGISSVQVNNSVKRIVGNNETGCKIQTGYGKALLKEFCAKHSSGMLQTIPPNAADFENVLSEVRKVQRPAEIFVKLLEIAYKISQAIPENECGSLGSILAHVTQFIWDYIKLNLREMSKDITVDDPSAQILLDRLIEEIMHRVVTQLDVWVQAFKEWLKNQFHQSLNDS